MNLKIIDIADVVKSSGLPPSTLRYYEQKGLIRSTGRHGLRRLYQANILEQLEFIALGRIAGFSLEEIRSMFASDGRLKIDRKLLLVKSAQLDKNIKQLIAIRNSLLHVANCNAPSHFECPKFQRLLRIAGKNQNKERVVLKKSKRTKS